MEKEKAAEATKTIDAEWKELQMLVSAVKVCSYLVHYMSSLPPAKRLYNRRCLSVC